jgi:hypothetical protein
MKLFHENNSPIHHEKLNAVDQNNVVLGYDLGRHCCENADWFISNIVEETPRGRADNEETLDLEAFYFDTSFFKLIDPCAGCDEGGMAIFRITDGAQDMFIHLYNSHNGYYGHGFTVEHSGQTIDALSGCL